MKAAVAASAMLLAGCAGAPAPGPLFFDDFSDADVAGLTAAGWQRRSAPGHPGLPGATWDADGVRLVDDLRRPGGRLLQLQARTDGTAAGTRHAQLCHQRKFLRGTYAARVRLHDEPAEGTDGDVVVQTFYAVSPLRFDFDPDYSEIDWEYLPNGGWGEPQTRLYAVSWQTARLDPWQAHNAPTALAGSHAGWHELVMQVDDHAVHWFVDGRPVARHGGRNVPAVPMAIQFNLWFSPVGLLPPARGVRVWRQEVDWVYHRPGAMVPPGQVAEEVRALRRGGVARRDTVPPADPPLPSTCDF